MACYRFACEADQGDATAPTFEELGRLARFIVHIEMELRSMGTHMKDVHEARNAAAILIERDAGAR